MALSCASGEGARAGTEAATDFVFEDDATDGVAERAADGNEVSDWLVELTAESVFEHAVDADESDDGARFFAYANRAGEWSVSGADDEKLSLTYLVEGSLAESSSSFPTGPSIGFSLHHTSSLEPYRVQSVPPGSNIGLGVALEDVEGEGSMLIGTFGTGYTIGKAGETAVFDFGLSASRQRQTESPNRYRTYLELDSNFVLPLGKSDGMPTLDAGISILGGRTQTGREDAHAIVWHTGFEFTLLKHFRLRTQYSSAELSGLGDGANDTIRRLGVSLVLRVPENRNEVGVLRPSLPSSFYRTSLRNTHRGRRWLDR